MAPHPLKGSALQLKDEVLRLMALVLGRPIGGDENPSRATEAGWDSLKHVELAFLVEDHFGVRFSEREVTGMEDAEQIVRVLEDKFAAQPRH